MDSCTSVPRIFVCLASLTNLAELPVQLRNKNESKLLDRSN